MTMNTEGKITCQVCGELTHSITLHIRDRHAGEITVEQYQERFPAAPLLSKMAEDRLAARAASKAATPPAAAPAASVAATPSAAPSTTSALTDGNNRIKVALHEAFGLGNIPAAKNKRGEPILINRMAAHDKQDLVPVRDDSYIFNIDLLKTILMGLELQIPVYIWGHAGTGKSTVYEQIFSCLNWPMIRVQHTANTEESHIIGQTLANEKGTYFEPGILPLCMRFGYAYMGDEYDRASPGVLSTYQPVLEGKALVIKEAPPEWRVVQPHPNFRFIANGNSNGSGDETGLYQSTMLQDASNYSRFGVVEEVGYMASSVEEQMLQLKTGITKEHAKSMVKFATAVRNAYKNQDITNPIGPRELLNAALLGMRLANFRQGVKLAFTNKLPERSRLACDEFAQREFGGTA